jgi:hypothetical protein
MIAVMTATIGLTACVKEEVNIGGNGDGVDDSNVNQSKNVTLKIMSGTSPFGTRATENAVSSKTITFNEGWLMFVSEQNNITKVMKITVGQQNVMTDASVDISLLTKTDGTEIPNVPGHSKSAYVVGNLPNVQGVAVPVTGGSLTAFRQNLIHFATQNDITNITLFGGDMIKLENQKNVARFNVIPLMARIEIEKISSFDSKSDIESFKIDGIFINNYYEQITLDGNATATTVYNKNVADFAEGTQAYPVNYKEMLYDYRSAAGQSLGILDGDTSYILSPGKAWAYNLLAPVTSSAGTISMPHIVLRLSDIQTKSGLAYNGEWYLTVSGLVDKNGKIDKLKPGTIYSIKNLKFAQSNIQPDPEMDTIDVNVEVTIVEWDIIDTDIIFGQE